MKSVILVNHQFPIPQYFSLVGNFEKIQAVRQVFSIEIKTIIRWFLFQNHAPSPYTHRNVANLAIKIGETTWAADFLNDFKEKLPIKERENLFLYNLAHLHFRKNDYPRAMALLRDVHLKEALQNLDARRMLMRMYYETGEYAALDSLLESFKTFIHRQKNLGYHRENYLNL